MILKIDLAKNEALVLLNRIHLQDFAEKHIFLLQNIFPESIKSLTA